MRFADLLVREHAALIRGWTELLAKVDGDQAPVEPAVLDENLAGAGPCHDDTCDVDARDIGLERFGVAEGTILFVAQLKADAAQEVVVGVIADEREDEVV